MTPNQFGLFKQIKIILGEIHLIWRHEVEFHREDGHCKSSEGAIEVSYDTWHNADNLEDYINCTAHGITIYSYIFGPSRSHDFYGPTAFQEALEEVKKWRNNYRKNLEEINNE